MPKRDSNFMENLTNLVKDCNLTKNAVIYCRSSTKKQNEYNHVSLEMQSFFCREYCKNNEFPVLTMINEVCSATKMSNQKKLLELVNGFNNINLIVYDASRFSRNILEGIQLLNECKDKKIILHNVKDNYSTEKHQGYLNFIDGLKNAECESKILSERVKSAIFLKRVQGNDIGNPAYGFKKERINGIIKFIDDERENLIKDFATKLYYGCSFIEANNIMQKITGEKIKSLFTEPCKKIEYGNFTYQMIAEFFNENNIKNRNDKEWSSNSISNIIIKRKLNFGTLDFISNKKTKTQNNINL